MQSLRHYDWTLHLAALVLCMYFLARAVTTSIGGMLEASVEVSELMAPPVEKPAVEQETESDISVYDVISERNIFNSAESATVSEVPTEELDLSQLGDLGPAVRTNLDIKVLGTLSVGEGMDRRSSAIVGGGGSKKAEVYYPGDDKAFSPNVRLMKVLKDRIEFVNGSRLEYAERVDYTAKRSLFASRDEAHGSETAPSSPDQSPDHTKEASPEGNKKVVLDQKEIDEALQNLDKLYSDVRIVPNFKDGQQVGMKVLSVKPGSVIAKLGVRRGDVLEKVNGQEIDVQKGMDLFCQMKDLKNFSVDLQRGGKNQTIDYEIR